MKNKMAILAVAVVLAAASFAYARHRYVSDNSAILTNPFNNKEKTTLTNPVLDQKLFGDWMKEEKAFAIIMPLLLLAGGAFAAFRR